MAMAVQLTKILVALLSFSPLIASAAEDRIFAIPPIGFGTWQLPATENATAAVIAAFRAGFRHFDCAPAYGNEKEVGEGIRKGAAEAGVKRGEYWVTSKLFNDDHAAPQAALDKTLADLGLDYLDLYLMHWPVGKDAQGKPRLDHAQTWRDMLPLLKSGKARHIGVSNFSPSQLTDVTAIHKPFAHQFEIHPYLPQAAFLEWHSREGVAVIAYSPLGNTNPVYHGDRKDAVGRKVPPLLVHPLLLAIAERRGCTPAQVALKWAMLRDTNPVVKSAREEKIREDWEALGCDLKNEDRRLLEGGMGENRRVRLNDLSAVWGIELFQGLDGKGRGGEAEGVFPKIIGFFRGIAKALRDEYEKWEKVGLEDGEL